MEPRHHHHYQSPSAYLLNHLRTQTVNTRPRIYEDDDPGRWRRPTFGGSVLQNPDSSHRKVYRRCEEDGDEVVVRLDTEATSRGLAEVTNRMEPRHGSGNALWISRVYEGIRPKHLPSTAYTERFRSLVRPSEVKDADHFHSRKRSNGDVYWQEREELMRVELRRCNRNSSQYFASRKQRPVSSLPMSSYPFSRECYESEMARYSATCSALEQSAPLNSRDDANTVKPTEEVPLPSTFKAPISSVAVPSLKVQRKHNYIEIDVADSARRVKTTKSGGGMLDILCSATLELGPIQANPSTGCSCPRSHCIKLYCDCFKAGRPCSVICSCMNCKNTAEETKVDGERIKAIKNTLARNPRAFNGGKKEAVPQNPGDIVCNCLKSRCLKLYCQCFHKGLTCNDACLCISCLNTKGESNVGGKRNLAIQSCLEKRPDAFTKKPKEVGSGCACKNNRCLKKYW